MAEAVSVEVAEAVIAAINAHDFGLAFTAELSDNDLSPAQLKDMTDLRVDVFTGPDESTIEARGTLIYDVITDIWIRNKFDINTQVPSDGKVDMDELKRVKKLAQDVWEFMVPCQPTQTGQLTTAAGYNAALDVERSRFRTRYTRREQTFRLFEGWVRLFYFVTKPVG